ncbi:MAG TPA: type IV toxin-antitoxin system AbiEi family antitoxin domain-containing protein, partial [Actinomycetes bacterium]
MRTTTAPPFPALGVRRGGVCTLAEALADGVPHSRVRRLLAAGLWVRVVGDVVAFAPVLPAAAVPLAWVAWLASGGVPSHLTAAAVLDPAG